MKINAYAKINLTLDITGIRPDKFHSIRSVMVPVSLCDVITVEKSNIFSFDCNIKSLVSDDNLCVRAARLFLAENGINENVSIYLEKNIPLPAGLGGGSSDAAAILNALNETFGCPMNRDRLLSLAAQLGSDIPFCLLCAPALCEGRGELITPVSNIPQMDIVIAIGEGRLPTPEVYRRYDEAGLEIRNDTEKLINAIKEGSGITALLGNAFEPVTDILAPETKKLRELMRSLGAKNSRLSGSGPSVYGVFEKSEEAENAAKMLTEMGYFAVSCKTLS